MDHFCNMVYFHAVKESAAIALFTLSITYGIFHEIAMDPGATYSADVFVELNRSFGTKTRFALVGVHTSSGVAGANNRALTLFRMLTTGPLYSDHWSCVRAWTCNVAGQ
jgi:hypothetical protein